MTDTDTSAAGSRRVRNAVPEPRRLSWVTWPSTQTSPSRATHSAIFIATVRTGHGVSGLVGSATQRDRSVVIRFSSIVRYGGRARCARS